MPQSSLGKGRGLRSAQPGAPELPGVSLRKSLWKVSFQHFPGYCWLAKSAFAPKCYDLIWCPLCFFILQVRTEAQGRSVSSRSLVL